MLEQRILTGCGAADGCGKVTNFAFTRLTALMLMLLCTTTSMGAYLDASGEIRASAQGCGVTWVSLHISNRTGAPQEGMVTFSEWNRDEVRVPIAPIPAGATRNINLAVPILNVTSANIKDADGTSRVSLESSSRYGGDYNRDYLLVNSRENQLTDTQMDDFTRANSPSTPYTMSMSSRGTTAPLMASERIITQMEPSALPENWLCLMPLRQVYISQNVERELTPGQRQALDIWTKLGGNLVYFDSETDDLFTTRGRGQIIHVTDNPVLHPNTSVGAAGGSPSGFVNSLAKLSLPYAEPYTGGRSFLFVLISVFMIAVGPVNYIYNARRNNIRALLKTVPAISLGFCSLIAVYFLATQGFARKGGSVSITMLDEANNRAMTFAKHSLISGLYPTGGFTFSRETYLHTSDSNLDGNLRMELDKEIKLTDGLFRPKIPFNYMTATPHTTRERLVIDPDFHSVRNGFELPLKAVAVFENDKLYTGGAGQSGAEIALVEGPLPDAQIALKSRQSESVLDAMHLVQSLKSPEMTQTESNFIHEQMRTLLMDSNLTSGTIYAAIFDGAPPGVEAGVTISDGKNLHVIFGVVDTEASE